jgi:hypothetical protein
MGGEQPSPLGDSDYREIAEEIAEAMKESAESARPKLPAPPSLPSLRDLWDLLSRYPIAWFVIGVVVVVIITVLFFEPLCCVLEFRLNEAEVALIALLAAGVAGMTFRIAPPQTDKAVTFILVVIVMKFLPPPSEEGCGFATRVATLTVAPTPTYTMTPTSTETLSNTPSPTPTPTLAAKATRF